MIPFGFSTRACRRGWKHRIAKRRRRACRARGVLLLEVMLALAIFVMAGIAILVMVEGTTSSIARSRDSARAADLARSTMARLEAGIGTVRTLHGPVRSWSEAADREDEFAVGFGDDVRGNQSPWEVEIETAPSQFEGLTSVSVHAFKRASRNSDQLIASYTLRQLVRLGAAADDEVGQEDSLLEQAQRGNREQQRGGGR